MSRERRCLLDLHKSKNLDLHNVERHEGVGRSLGSYSRAMADMDYTDTGDEVEILVGEPEIRGFVIDDLGDENVEDNRIKPVKREAGRSVVSEVVDGVLKEMETLAVQSVDLRDEAGCSELLR